MTLAFIGSKHLGLRILQAMHETVPVDEIVTLDDRRDVRSAHDEIVRFAREHQTPLRDNPAADVGIVCGWYHRLAGNLFGFHASPLPRYRGQAPIPWQIINGEPSVGLTLFKLTEGLDEGPIVSQGAVPLAVNQTVADALDGIGDLAVGMIRAKLPAIIDGTVELVEQDHSQATYCGVRKPANGLIDWDQPARRVHDFIRAQARPYAGAFTILPNGDRLTVWRSEVDSRRWLAVPGSVVEVDGAAVVGCAEGAVRVLDTDPVELRVGMQLSRISNETLYPELGRM